MTRGYTSGCIRVTDCATGHEVTEELHALIGWLCEFVEEPEWFPNGGDRQFWRERYEWAQRLGAPPPASPAVGPSAPDRPRP